MIAQRHNSQNQLVSSNLNESLLKQYLKDLAFQQEVFHWFLIAFLFFCLMKLLYELCLKNKIEMPYMLYYNCFLWLFLIPLWLTMPMYLTFLTDPLCFLVSLFYLVKFLCKTLLNTKNENEEERDENDYEPDENEYENNENEYEPNENEYESDYEPNENECESDKNDYESDYEPEMQTQINQITESLPNYINKVPIPLPQIQPVNSSDPQNSFQSIEKSTEEYLKEKTKFLKYEAKHKEELEQMTDTWNEWTGKSKNYEVDL